MPAVGETTEEHRMLGRGVAKIRGASQHDAAVGDEHLVATVDTQHASIRPPGDGGVDIGAQGVGAVGADTGQQGDVAQAEIHYRSSFERT